MCQVLLDGPAVDAFAPLERHGSGVAVVIARPLAVQSQNHYASLFGIRDMSRSEWPISRDVGSDAM